MSFLSTKFLLY